MSARLRIVHTTGFTYSGPVTSSFNEARITPRSDSRQTVVVDHVDTVPAARQFRYSDYWATTVTVFDLHSPHERLEVIGTAVVEAEDEVRGEEATSIDWVQLRNGSIVDDYDDMLRPTVYTPHTPEITAFAAAAADGLRPADAADQREADAVGECHLAAHFAFAAWLGVGHRGDGGGVEQQAHPEAAHRAAGIPRGDARRSRVRAVRHRQDRRRLVAGRGCLTGRWSGRCSAGRRCSRAGEQTRAIENVGRLLSMTQIHAKPHMQRRLRALKQR